MNTTLALIARILLASIYLISGALKIKGFAGVAGMMASAGFPMADVFLVLTIALELVGGAMLVVNWNARYAALALAAFTLAAGSIFHGFWHAKPELWFNELNHFLKNLAIVGGLLMVAAAAPEEKKA